MAGYYEQWISSLSSNQAYFRYPYALLIVLLMHKLMYKYLYLSKIMTPFFRWSYYNRKYIYIHTCTYRLFHFSGRCYYKLGSPLSLDQAAANNSRGGSSAIVRRAAAQTALWEKLVLYSSRNYYTIALLGKFIL